MCYKVFYYTVFCIPTFDLKKIIGRKNYALNNLSLNFTDLGDNEKKEKRKEKIFLQTVIPENKVAVR